MSSGDVELRDEEDPIKDSPDTKLLLVGEGGGDASPGDHVAKASTKYCVRVSGLPWHAKEEDVVTFFKPFEVVRVAPIYYKTEKPGAAFVYFTTDDMAQKAMEEKYLGGHRMKCSLMLCTEAAELEAQWQDQFKTSLFIRLSGLPFTAKESDVMALLAKRSIQAVEGSCIIEFGADGKPSGWASVKLETPEEVDKALKMHTLVHVKVFKVTIQEAKQLQETLERGGNGYVVKLCGLPRTADEQQVLEFMQGVNIAPCGIHMVDADYGTASDTCFVELVDEAALDAAIAKHGQTMGTHHVNVCRSTRIMLTDYPPLPVEADGPFVVWLLGLPSTMKGVDIVKQLFPDLDTAPQGIHLVLRESSSSHVKAFVEFSNKQSYEAALSRSGRLLAGNYDYVQRVANTGLPLDVIPSNKSVMHHNYLFVDEEGMTAKHPQCGRLPGAGGAAFSSHIREVLAVAPNCEWSKKWIAFCRARGVPCDSSLDAAAAVLAKAMEVPPAIDTLGDSSQPFVGRRINLAQRQRDTDAKLGHPRRKRKVSAHARDEEDPIKYSPDTKLLLVGEGGGDASPDDQQQGCAVPEREPVAKASTKYCVRVRGLLWRTKEEDVVTFFKPLEVVRVAPICSKTGTPGVAFVVYFTTDDMAHNAIEKDRQDLGGHRMKCYLMLCTEAAKREAQWQDQFNFIRLSGLPFTAKESDVMALLAKRSIQAVEGSCIIEFGADGKPSGWASVKLETPEEVDKALKMHTLVHVKVFKVTIQEAKQLQETLERGGNGYVVKLCGLPRTADEQQVLEFMQGVNIAPCGIHMVDADYGTASDTCFVELVDEAALDAAIAKHGQTMGTHHVNVCRSTRIMLTDYPPLPVEADGPFVVWLLGLPSTMKGVDIVKQLFPDLDTAPQGIHLVLRESSSSHVKAFVEFSNKQSYEAALSRSGRLLAGNYDYVQRVANTGLPLDVIPSNKSVMHHNYLFVDEEGMTAKHPQCGRLPGAGGAAFSSHIREVLAVAPNCEWSKKWIAFCRARGVPCDSSLDAAAAVLAKAMEVPPAIDTLGDSSQPFVGRRINLAQRQRDTDAKLGHPRRKRKVSAHARDEEDPIKYSPDTKLLLVGEGGGDASPDDQQQGCAVPEREPVAKASTKYCVRVRGLLWRTKEEDVVTFFKPLEVVRVAPICSKTGTPGVAFVVYFTTDDMAHNAIEKDRQDLGGHRMKCYLMLCTEAAKREAQWQDQFNFIRLSGLPFTAKESDVMALLAKRSIQAVEGSCIIEFGADGKPSGWASVKLETPEEVDKALKMHTLVHVKVFKVTIQEAKQLQETLERGGNGYVVKLCGLPRTADEQQVLEFMQGVNIAPCGIHMVDADYGTASDTCFVELVDEAALDAAIAKHGQTMGTHHVNVCRSTRIMMTDYPPLPVEADGPFVVWLPGLAGNYDYVQRVANTGLPLDVIPSNKSVMHHNYLFVDEEGMTAKHPQGGRLPGAGGAAFSSHIREVLAVAPNCEWSKKWIAFCRARGVPCDSLLDAAAAVLAKGIEVPPALDTLGDSSQPFVGRRINLAQRQRDTDAKVGRPMRKRKISPHARDEEDPIKYSPDTKLLLVGEGDFAYAAALCQHFGTAPQVVATGYDDEEAVLKLPEAQQNIDKVRACSAQVLHGVDATKLSDLKQHHPCSFDVIRWNSPDSGAANVAFNWRLLEEFLVSALDVLRPGGELHIEEIGGDLANCVKVERHANPFPDCHPHLSCGRVLTDEISLRKVYTFRRASELSSLDKAAHWKATANTQLPPAGNLSDAASSGEQQQDAPVQPEREPVAKASTKYCVRVSGLPWHAKEEDVVTFFKPLEVVRVAPICSKTGTPGVAFVVYFTTDDMAHNAIEKDRQDLGGHRMKCYLMLCTEAAKREAQWQDQFKASLLDREVFKVTSQEIAERWNEGDSNGHCATLRAHQHQQPRLGQEPQRVQQLGVQRRPSAVLRSAHPHTVGMWRGPQGC